MHIRTCVSFDVWTFVDCFVPWLPRLHTRLNLVFSKKGEKNIITCWDSFCWWLTFISVLLFWYSINMVPVGSAALFARTRKIFLQIKRRSSNEDKKLGKHTHSKKKCSHISLSDIFAHVWRTLFMWACMCVWHCVRAYAVHDAGSLSFYLSVSHTHTDKRGSRCVRMAWHRPMSWNISLSVTQYHNKYTYTYGKRPSPAHCNVTSFLI